MHSRLFAVFVALAWLGVSLPGWAAADQRKSKSHEYSKISSVDTVAKTVTVYEVSNKGDVIYPVGPFTRILVNGQAGKLEELKVGMKVDVTASGGGRIVSRIEAVPYPSDQEETKPKREYSKISAVDAVAKTVTVYEVSNKGDVVYPVGPFTRILVNGQAGKLEDLKVGMKVDVTSSGGGRIVSTIEAVPYPVDKEETKRQK